MNNIFEPLTLARGSHTAGSGQGCAMNVISWENGDTQITDYPECSDRLLARLVQHVNDGLANRNGFLSPENSIIALDLGHATVGTTKHTLNDEGLRKVYVQLAQHLANKVYAPSSLPSNFQRSAAKAALRTRKSTSLYSANENAFTTYHYTLLALYETLDTPSWPELSVNLARESVDLAREVIDLFKELTGTQSPTPESEAVACAVKKMQKVHA